MANFVRSNLIVASGTACSRATGLLRVIVLAYVVGQNALSDAYKLSNETPNIVYDLVIGGVLSATLVPVFTSLIVQERRSDDDERGFMLSLALPFWRQLCLQFSRWHSLR